VRRPRQPDDRRYADTPTVRETVDLTNSEPSLSLLAENSSGSPVPKTTRTASFAIDASQAHRRHASHSTMTEWAA
jgi:hypothetical protein